MGTLVTAKTDVVTITSSSHRKMTRVRVRAGLDGFLIDWDQVNDVPLQLITLCISALPVKWTRGEQGQGQGGQITRSSRGVGPRDGTEAVHLDLGAAEQAQDGLAPVLPQLPQGVHI